MVSSTAAIAALLSTGFISLAPNLILLAFPSYAVGEGAASPVLTLGQALAAGGLLGDVFLHTLPSATADVEEVELMILLGFTLFLMADMLIRSLGGGHSHSHGDENDKEHSHQDNKKPKASVIVLNLVADAMHNFTDGLAIGASFALSNSPADLSVTALLLSRGGLATLSILCHEIPHELGDFATLVRAGYSKNQAVKAQFMTAIAAFTGTVVALYLSEGWIGERLLYVTAGGFIYLATVTILPEVLEDDRHSAAFRLAQLTAFLAGIGFLYLVYLLEEYEHKDAAATSDRTLQHGEPQAQQAHNNHGHNHGHGHRKQHGHGHGQEQHGAHGEL